MGWLVSCFVEGEGWGCGVRTNCQQPSVSIIRYIFRRWQIRLVIDWEYYGWIFEASLSWTDFYVSFFISVSNMNFVGEYTSIIFFVLRKHFTTLHRRTQHFSSFLLWVSLLLVVVCFSETNP